MHRHVVPVRNKREARQEAFACKTVHEAISMMGAIHTELHLLRRHLELALAIGDPGQRFLARRLLKRRRRVLRALQRHLDRRFRLAKGLQPFPAQ